MDQIEYMLNGYWDEISDPRSYSKDYPLMSGGPLPCLILVAVYLYFVLYFGPRWMKNREPFDLKVAIRIYNLGMSLINLYALYCIFTASGNYIDRFICKKEDRKLSQDVDFVHMGWVYMMSRMIELLDTVFFILRKKNNQVTRLHLFHHSSVVIAVWSYTRITPFGSAFFAAFLNCSVHYIMYAYYFLATYKSLQPYLWWKRYLTVFQIIQFVLNMIHTGNQAFFSDCPYPVAFDLVNFTLNMIFVFLFSNFYYHSYLKKTKKTQ